MLKKAGIIVSAAAATLLAVSPLAFADVSGDHNNGIGGSGNSVDHTSMGLVNASGNDANGTVNGGCGNDVAAGLLAAAQKGAPIQGVGDNRSPVSATNNLTTQDKRNCGTSGTVAGNRTSGAEGGTASTSGNSTDHTSMGLANASGNDVNGTVNGVCSNDVAAGGVALQKGAPVQAGALLGALAPQSATNTLTNNDDRLCNTSGTSAGNTAGR